MNSSQVIPPRVHEKLGSARSDVEGADHAEFGVGLAAFGVDDEALVGVDAGRGERHRGAAGLAGVGRCDLADRLVVGVEHLELVRLFAHVVHHEADRVAVGDAVEIQVLVVEVDRVEADLTVGLGLLGAALAGDGECGLESVTGLAGLAAHDVVARDEIDGERARGAGGDVLDLSERVAVRLQHVQLVDLAALVDELEADLAGVDDVVVEDARIVGAGDADGRVGRIRGTGAERQQRGDGDGEDCSAWGHGGAPRVAVSGVG